MLKMLVFSASHDQVTNVKYIMSLQHLLFVSLGEVEIMKVCRNSSPWPGEWGTALMITGTYLMQMLAFLLSSIFTL